MEDRIPELLQRHRAFWAREKVDRPLLTIMKFNPLAPKILPLTGVSWGEEDIELAPEMFDARQFTSVEQWHNVPGSLLMGDSFSVRQPFVRVPWVEAILGCPIWADRDSGSIWSESTVRDPRAALEVKFDPDNAWYRKLSEMTKVLVEESDGSYLVAQTLMRGPIDMVRAFLGDNETCLAIVDVPDVVTQLLDETTDVFIAIAKGQTAFIPRFHDGYCSYFGIWAPDTVVRTQCDMSALLSPKTYAEMVVPFEEKVCRPFVYSVIHLHSGFLHTVDALLEAELPTCIEIALDTGSTPVTVRDLVPVCRKILARKPLIFEGHMTAAELEHVLDSLPAAGLYVNAMLDESEIEKLRPTLRQLVS